MFSKCTVITANQAVLVAKKCILKFHFGAGKAHWNILFNRQQHGHTIHGKMEMWSDDADDIV